MDFDLLPPEINSMRMYSGPGSGPLLAAATAWDGLAGELTTSAAGFSSVVTTLTADAWRGPSSTAMTAAAAGYVAWLHRTAAHAEQTAGQAKAAVFAYQTAFAMTVPPPLIAANRSQLLALVAANLFGQNSPAIAATEADYEQMWAQDVTAMNGYALSSSGATQLTSFVAPPPSLAGVSAQALPQASQLAAPAVTTPGLATYMLQIPSLTSAAASTSSSSFSGISMATTNNALAINALRDDVQGIGPFQVGSPRPATPVVAAPRPPASALLGEASLAGRLAVPQSWAATVRPTITTAPAAPALVPAAAAPIAESTFTTGMFGEALLGTMAGRGVSNTAAKRRRRGVKDTPEAPRTPATG